MTTYYMKITIQPQDKIERIDKFLAEKFKISRAFIQKQIKNGSITVNNDKINAHYKPMLGDIIEIEKTEKDPPDISPSKTIKFKIIEKTDDYIVIEKPARLVVHPAEGIHELTLVNGLLAKYPEIAKVGENELRPGIVHRLDRDVSGLMVIARTQKMFDHLKKQFQERSIEKEYTALVHGVIEDEDGTINTPIGRSKTKDGKMAAHSQETEGDREAITEFEVIERKKNYTLLSVKILTGRSHQIRVHLNSIEYPIVGDKLYTNKRIKNADLNRLFLHASRLAFNDLDSERKEYKSKLPKELINFLSSC